jgi:hypothetical protein
MALADGAELIILAPGVQEFGEDKGIDKLIRKYGYRGTPATLKAVKRMPTWRGPERGGASDSWIVGGAVHDSLVPGELSREEIEGVGFEYGDLKAMLRGTIRKSCATAGTRWAAKRFSLSRIRGWDCGRTAAGLSARKVPANLAHSHAGMGSGDPGNFLTEEGMKNSQTGKKMGIEGLKLNKYSVGTGDRFAHQAKAQLQACVKALGAWG